MTIEYAYGDTNTEGFATIITDNKKDRIIYRLDKFTMVEKDGKFELPGRPATCN